MKYHFYEASQNSKKKWRGRNKKERKRKKLMTVPLSPLINDFIIY